MSDTYPKDYFKLLAMLESSGKPSAKAKTSSASGLFQFVGDTWKGQVKQMGKNYSLEDRNDPKKAEEVVRHFTDSNRKYMQKKLGRPLSTRDLYLGHFLGMGGGTKFIKAAEKNSSAVAKDLFPTAASRNEHVFYKPDSSPRTLAEVQEYLDGRISDMQGHIDAGRVPDVVKNIGKPQEAGDFSDTEIDDNRFVDTSQGKTEFTKVKKPKEYKAVEEGPSQNVDYPDLTDRPFKEAFNEAREELKSPFFRWKGKLFHTQTPEEVMSGISGKKAEPEEAAAAEPKEEKVEPYLDKAPEPLAEYKPAPGDMLGGELFSMAPRYPVPDIMDKPTRKTSDILKKTTEENYDKMKFDEAFAKARKQGKGEFSWKGKPYTTKYKEEM